MIQGPSITRHRRAGRSPRRATPALPAPPALAIVPLRAVLLAAGALTTLTLAASPAPAQIVAPPGFEVTLFRDADITFPTSLAFDTLGRLFVSEGSHISIVVDTTGDGQADLVRVFASGLSSSLGIAFRGGDLYTSQSSKVTLLRDTDGDDDADLRQDLITGLPVGRHQTDGLAFGPDDSLYICQGSRSDAGEGGILPNEACILKASVTGANVHVLANGIRNPYDLAFHSNGDLFATDNGRDFVTAPDELNFIVPGGDYGWPDCWGNNHGSNCTGTLAPVAELEQHSSSDGLCFYTGTDWPNFGPNDLFIAQWGELFGGPSGHRVKRARLIDLGNNYAAVVEDFITGMENPLDVLMSPTGDLYIADYGGGPNFDGAIYRVRYTGPVGRFDRGRLRHVRGTLTRLEPAVPNPFNPMTTLSYVVPEVLESEAGNGRGVRLTAGSGREVPVRLSVYSARGALVRTLVDAPRVPGSYQAIWDGRDDAGRAVGSGIYFASLEVGEERSVEKLVLAR